MNLNLPSQQIDFSQKYGSKCDCRNYGRNRQWKTKPADLKNVIEAKNRGVAGTSAPAHALF